MKDAAAALAVTLLLAGCRTTALPVAPAAPPVPAAAAPAARPEARPEARPDPFPALGRELRHLGRRVPGSGLALWVEDRLTGRRWGLNADLSMRSASLIKIPVAAVALQQWQRRPERRTPAISKRVWRTIAESHNVSTDVVVDHVGGLGRINRFCAGQGWSRTRMNHKMMAWRTRKAHNVTTARDVAAMLRSIDAGTLVSRPVSEGLWKLLRDQEIVDRIPAAIPKRPDVEVGNKTGTMLSVVHDAGIVRGPGVRYLLVIMINRPRSEDAADAFCRSVSARVWKALGTR